MALTVVVRPADPEARPLLSLTLDAPRIVIGRAEGCEIRLPDRSVSPRHASLRQDGADYLLLDENSSNGTYLAGLRLAPHVPRIVAHGDRVRIGRWWLELRLDASASPSPGSATKALARVIVERRHQALGLASQPQIVVRQGPDAGKTLPLDQPETWRVLGRGPDVDWLLEEKDASRQHLEFQCRGEQIWVRDLGSKNGSVLAGERLVGGQEVLWRRGEELRIGADTFVCEHPVLDALTELDRGADDVIDEVEQNAMTLSLKDEAAFAPVGLVRETATGHENEATGPLEPPGTSKASGSSGTWGSSDVLIVLVAVVVFALSGAGLWLLFRG